MTTTGDSTPTTPPAQNEPNPMVVPDAMIEDGKILGRFDNINDALAAIATAKDQSPPSGDPVTPPPAATPPAEGDASTGDGFRIPEPAPQTGGLTAERRAELGREALANNGTLTEESFTALEAQGYPRDLVTSYLQAQVAVRASEQAKLTQDLGGQPVVDGIMRFAGTLPEAERSAIQASLDSSDAATQRTILEGLKARAGISNVTTVQGSLPEQTSAVAFKTEAHMQRAMMDPRYATDPDYREEVEARTRAMLRKG